MINFFHIKGDDTITTTIDNDLQLFITYARKHFTDDQIAQLIQSNELTGSQGLRRMLGEIDIAYFALTYLPEHFDKPFCQFHFDLIESVQDLTKEYHCQTDEAERLYRTEKEGQRLLTISPRGHGKSRIITVLLNLWKLVYRKSPFIMTISANDNMAQSFLEQVKKALEDNEKVIEDFGKLRGDTWNKSQINLTNNTALVAKGIKSKLRGYTLDEWRPTSIVLDDIEDDRQASSELSTDEIKHIFRHTIMELGDRYTDIIFVGTLINENTLINELYKTGTGWKKLFFKAVYEFSDSSLWEEWEKIYTDLTNPNHLDDANSFYEQHKQEMTTGTHVLWPEKNDYYYLMRKKIDNGEQAFYSELQNDPRSSSDYIFQKLSYWNQLPPMKDMDVILAVDPSVGKNRNSDYAAWCIMARHKETNYKHVIDAQILKIPLKQLLDEIIALCKDYSDIAEIVFESVSFADYVADDLKDMLKKEEMYHIILKKLNSRRNKHNRITNLEPFISRGEILFNKDSIRFNTQVLDYNINAKNDDAPDVLQMAFEQIEKIRKPKQIVSKPSWL